MFESFLATPTMWVWLFLTIVFAVVEVMTLGVVSIWFAIGALITMLFSFVVDVFIIQVVIFLATSLVLVFTTRKFAVEKLKIGSQKTNLDSLIGKKAIVIKAIQPLEAGEVKVDGKPWRALSQSGTSYSPGDLGEVLKIEGVTIILK